MSEPDSRLVDPHDPQWCVTCLGRKLLLHHPDEAEFSWRDILNPEVTAKCPKDTWIELREGERSSYFLFGIDSGRYSAIRPSDVTEFYVIERTGSAPTTLREFMQAQMRRVWSPRRPAAFYDDVLSAMNIYASHSPNTREWYRQALAMSVAIESSNDTKAREREFLEFLKGFTDLGAAGTSTAQFFEEHGKKIRSRFNAHDLCGSLARDYILLDELTKTLPRAGVAVVAKYGSQLSNPADLVHIARAILSKMEQGPSLLESASKQLMSEADTFVASLASAQSLDRFYECHFRSYPLYSGACLGFQLLFKNWENQSRAKILSSVCDEGAATAVAAVGNAFNNSLDWKQLRFHRDKVAAVRRLKGRVAAEDLAHQYTDFALYYPKYLLPFLLGETEEFPMSLES